jgi:trehalose-6-phosphatase
MDLRARDYDFNVSTGKKVFEIKPKIDWNKGIALKYFYDMLNEQIDEDAKSLNAVDNNSNEKKFFPIGGYEECMEG